MSEMQLDDQSLDVLFREARSFSHWLNKPVTDKQLQAVYELMKFGPTAANSCPVRLVFVRSDEARARLKPCLDEGNVQKSMSAPAVAIIGMDMEFYEQLGKLFPHNPGAREWYAGKPEKIAAVAGMNSTLQGAYLMLAARSLGLDCGPMSGFDADKLNAEFFPDGKIKANFICALGYGNREKLYPRGPRLTFNEACSLA